MSSIFKYRYLSQDQLKRLDSYKYAALDTSPVSKYIMHPFWNFVVEFVPKNIAPNVLTLAGFGCTLATACLLTYHDYHFDASSDDVSTSKPIPSIIWLICSLNLFLSHTLDGIDGKQARRTKAMGPLGELMDHGVDSWTAVFVTMQVYSFFGSQDWSFGPYRMFFVLWSVFISFYITHWEKYNTGVLFLPWSYDFSQVFLVGCSLATYWNSYQVWKSYVPLVDMSCSQFFELILYFSVLSTLPAPLYNVYTASKNGISKYKKANDVLRPLFPLVALLIVSTLWATFSRADIINQDPRVYYFLVGTVFSNISCRLIVCQMSSTKCELINGCTVMFAIVALISLLIPSAIAIELLLLRLLSFTVTLVHLHYAISVIRQLCDHFKINCLTLTKRTQDSSRQLMLKKESSISSPSGPLNNNFGKQ